MPAYVQVSNPAMKLPVISIIMATYNRSNIISYAIRSALHQSFQEWELIVVGDACTDDTEAVVNSISDPRIRFVNLSQNCGDQSGPNNFGASMARGKWIAYLNHDDLWFPDHLQICLDAATKDNLEMVCTMEAIISPKGSIHLLHGAPENKHRPGVIAPASSWILSTELLSRTGGWKSPSSLYGAPSQDLLHRVFKSGAPIQHIPILTVLGIASGDRPNCYLHGKDHEHQEWLQRMKTDPELRHHLLATSLCNQKKDAHRLMWLPATLLLKAMVQKCAAILTEFTGINWIEAVSFFRHHRRGKFIKKLRKKRGLDQGLNSISSEKQESKTHGASEQGNVDGSGKG